MSRELLQRALDALNESWTGPKFHSLIDDIEAELAKPEPVAFFTGRFTVKENRLFFEAKAVGQLPGVGARLYTHLPRQQEPSRERTE